MNSTETVAIPEPEMLHKRPIRWMHWINFPLLTIMVWSGLRIYWADVRDPYAIGISDTDFTFFPTKFNEILELDRKLAKGMAYHFLFGWLFVINGLLFTFYTFKSGHWKELFPQGGFRALKNAGIVTLHEIGLWRKPLPEQGKFNAAQQITYSLIIGLGAISVFTGFAIYKPTQLSQLTWIFGGYEMARTIHFGATIIFMVFFVIHVLQVAKAGWGTFMGMVTGYDRKALIEAADIDDMQQVKTDLALRSRRSVIVGGFSAFIGLMAFRSTQVTAPGDRIPQAMRNAHELNESVWRRIYRKSKFAPTFDRSESSELRVNGRHGIRSELDASQWELQVIGPNGDLLGTEVMADIMTLPKQEMTVEHKCVEGWSHIVTWGGTSFSEFAKKYEPQLGELPRFVNLRSPSGQTSVNNEGETLPDDYYVSLDIESMMHPQTMLTYELQNEPLSQTMALP